MNTPVAALPFLATLISVPLPILAAPILGSDLSTFTVLGAETVTNVPVSTVDGNIGVWAGTSITGFLSTSGTTATDPNVTNGLVQSATPLAQSAQAQLTQARNDLWSMGTGTVLGPNLTGLTLAPGVYTVSAAATNLAGTLTLDGGGDVNAAWVFNMTSTLITSSYSVVNMINASSVAGLFWNVASSATIGTYSTFMGNVLALTSISVNTGATNACGRFFADTAAVTLQMNTLSRTCFGDLAGSDGLSGGLDVTDDGEGGRTVAFVPAYGEGGQWVELVSADEEGEGTVALVSAAVSAVSLPGALGLLGLGVAGLIAVRRKPSTV
ncbi:MAG: hypothetical protein ACI9ZH_001747 [Paracoccaceae bacterium]|jgi:hypothetical protein